MRSGVRGWVGSKNTLDQSGIKKPKLSQVGMFWGYPKFQHVGSTESKIQELLFSSFLQAGGSNVEGLIARAFGHCLSGISAQTWNKLDDQYRYQKKIQEIRNKMGEIRRK